MGGPWEKYQSQPVEDGPWTKYAAQPVQGAPASSDEDPYDRSTILPFSRNKETGEIDMTVPGLLKDQLPELLKDLFKAGTSAVTAPGRAMKGEFNADVTSEGFDADQTVKEAMNMAMFTTPTSAARPVLTKSAAKAVPEGRKVAESAVRQGVNLPKAAVSDNIVVQQTGKNVSNIPVVNAPMRKASETAISQLDDAARRTQQGYGTGSTATAGSMVRTDATNYAKKTLSDRVTARYDKVDELVQPNVVTQLTRTRQVAGDILASRKNAMIGDNSKAVQLIAEAAQSPQGLNYQGLKQLRTYVGEFLDDPQKLAASGMSKAELKRVYGALTDDMRVAVKKAGGRKALGAWENANTFAAKTANERKALDKIIGRTKSDEAIASSILSMAGSTSRADVIRLGQARRAVSKETWDELASSIIAQMGRDNTNNFSPERFLTAYGKLSERGKAMLFKTTGKKDLAQALDDIALVSKRFKRLNEFANPSGTGQQVASTAIGAGLIAEPMTTLASITGGAGLSYLLSRPVTAKQVANWARTYEKAARTRNPRVIKLLEDRTAALAAAAGIESRSLLPSLNSARPVPADPGRDDDGVEERE